MDRSRDLTNVPKNPERLTAFAGLAKALKRTFPIDEESGEEAFWDRDLLLDAKATKGFVFLLEPPSDALPPEQLMTVFVKQAKKLGLVIFYHDTNTCFLPDGRIFPKEVKAALKYANARPQRPTAREILAQLQEAIEPSLSERNFALSSKIPDGGKTRECWYFTRKWGAIEQQLCLYVKSSEPAWLEIRTFIVYVDPTEGCKEYDWGANSRGRFDLFSSLAWSAFSGLENERDRIPLEEPEGYSQIARFIQEVHLPFLDNIKDCESFNVANSNLRLPYEGRGSLFETTNLVAAWSVRNAMYLQALARGGRGYWYLESARVWIVEQQTQFVRPDGSIDLDTRARLQPHRYRLDHVSRLTSEELERNTLHLGTLANQMATHAISKAFKLLPIDPDEPLVRRWSRQLGGVRQELRVGLGWRFGKYVDSVLCYFYSEEMEQGFERLGIPPRGRYVDYTSINSLVPKAVFVDKGCYSDPATIPQVFHGLIRPDDIDTKFMADFICQEFLPRLDVLNSLESIAKLVHSAKPDSPVYLHLYDRSVMLAWLTSHPILADYASQWPEKRKELLNEKGEITKLGHDIDVMIDAIAKVTAKGN